jgi:hypothetical protein
MRDTNREAHLEREQIGEKTSPFILSSNERFINAGAVAFINWNCTDMDIDFCLNEENFTALSQLQG